MLWNAKCSVVAQPTFGIKVQIRNQITFAQKNADHMLLITQPLDDQVADIVICLVSSHKTR